MVVFLNRELSAGRLFPRIGFRDDDADGVLIEAFEAAFPLEVLQVAADRAPAREFVELLLRDRTALAEFLGSLTSDGPTFAFGECLFQKWKVGERLHGVDAFGLELLA